MSKDVIHFMKVRSAEPRWIRENVGSEKVQCMQFAFTLLFSKIGYDETETAARIPYRAEYEYAYNIQWNTSYANIARSYVAYVSRGINYFAKIPFLYL